MEKKKKNLTVCMMFYTITQIILLMLFMVSFEVTLIGRVAILASCVAVSSVSFAFAAIAGQVLEEKD